MKARLTFASLLLLPLLATGCAIGPDYERPTVETPTTYKEVKGWKPAEPNDTAPRGNWWEVYNDPILNALEKQIDISNQNLKQYEAAYREAVAATDQSRSSLFPTLGLDKSATRKGTGKYNAANTASLSANAAWSIDIWGKLRRQLESDEASAEASAADLAAARLSAQATLADTYFTLRVQDELQRLLDQTTTRYEKIRDIADNNYKAGVSSLSDLMAAQTQAESAKSAAIANGVKRAQLEHAIAVLVGQAPASFDLPPSADKLETPIIPATVPSALLERRPDIASAERQMAAANALIGVAIGGYYPDLTLSASYGFSASTLDNLLKATSAVWAIGADSNGTLLDFGGRSGKVDAARAAYDKTVASYRQTVLDAFKGVEDNLVAQRLYAEQEKAQEAAVASARKAEQVALNQYKEGVIPYNEVLTAQVTRLSNEQSLLTVKNNRLSASVSLIEALGGGWHVAPKE